LFRGNPEDQNLEPTPGQAFLAHDSDHYREPIDFYSQTLFTKGLYSLLSNALGRISGQGGDPIVELNMNAGAGQTHSMIALYHLFCGVPVGRLPGIGEVAHNAGVSQLPKVYRAVLAGERISPATVHEKADGTVVKTLWGELAWQLGGREGYDMVREADQTGTSPGGSLLFLLQRFSPCLILIDDWGAYIHNLHRDPSLSAADFEAHLGFAQTLGQCVRCTARALLVVTISKSSEEPEIAGKGAAGDQLRNALATTGVAAPPVDESRLLDDLFRATVAHRSSQVYRDLLDYVSRFRRYSAYNGYLVSVAKPLGFRDGNYLVRIQRPTVGYVATPSDWMKDFERRVKPDARPLVMLKPFGPVMFVYDIADTDGEQSPPADLLMPFDAKGVLDPAIWSNTERNCSRDQIRILPRDMSLNSAGWARCTRSPGPKQVPEFEVTYNKNQKQVEAYCTVVHELAHIYLGHVCGHPRRKWPDRSSESKDVREFEAESAAYIVCARQGIVTTAPPYLADYLGHNDGIPAIDINRVLAVASKIEELGRMLRKSKKHAVEREEED
jgi:hypothetical protein